MKSCARSKAVLDASHPAGQAVLVLWDRRADTVTAIDA
jgi:hypothetical protein